MGEHFSQRNEELDSSENKWRPLLNLAVLQI